MLLLLFISIIVSFTLSFFYPSYMILCFIPPTILFGISFYLDGKETIKCGKESIIRYERNIVIRNFTKKFGVHAALFTQAILEGIAFGWVTPFLFQDFYWYPVTFGICVFTSFIHITGFVHNKHLLTKEEKRNIYIKLLFDTNITLSLK